MSKYLKNMNNSNRLNNNKDNKNSNKNINNYSLKYKEPGNNINNYVRLKYLNQFMRNNNKKEHIRKL